MTDLEIAKSALTGHTICLCKDGKCLMSEKRGIAPMMGFIEEGVDLAGYSVADLVVGKAAAMLFVKCGIAAVYAKTLSQSGKEFLERHGIECHCDTLVERIINREGTDVCPMEKTVATCNDVEEAHKLIKNKLAELRAKAIGK